MAIRAKVAPLRINDMSIPPPTLCLAIRFFRFGTTGLISFLMQTVMRWLSQVARLRYRDHIPDRREDHR